MSQGNDRKNVEKKKPSIECQRRTVYVAVCVIFFVALLIGIGWFMDILCPCNSTCVGCIHGFSPWYCTSGLNLVLIVFVLLAIVSFLNLGRCLSERFTHE